VAGLVFEGSGEVRIQSPRPALEAAPGLEEVDPVTMLAGLALSGWIGG